MKLYEKLNEINYNIKLILVINIKLNSMFENSLYIVEIIVYFQKFMFLFEFYKGKQVENQK